MHPLKLGSKVSLSRRLFLTWAGELPEESPRPTTVNFPLLDFFASPSFSSTLALGRERFRGLVRSFAAELLVGERYVAFPSNDEARESRPGEGKGEEDGDGFPLGIGEFEGDGVTLTVSLMDDVEPVLVRLSLAESIAYVRGVPRQ